MLISSYRMARCLRNVNYERVRLLTSSSSDNRLSSFAKIRAGNVSPVVTLDSLPDNIARPEYITDPQSHKIEHVIWTPSVEPVCLSDEEIPAMKRTCFSASKFCSQAASLLTAGVTGDHIEREIHKAILAEGCYPSLLFFEGERLFEIREGAAQNRVSLFVGFPKSISISVNHVAVRGVPDDTPFKAGDLVSICVAVFREGFHGCCTHTYIVDEQGNDQDNALMHVVKQCFEEGLKVCGPDVPFCNVGLAIYREVHKYDMHILHQFSGHGIGKNLIMEPVIYSRLNGYYGVMRPGMTFTIAPCLSNINSTLSLCSDGFGLAVSDGSRAAQWESTVLITENGAEVLTT